MHDSHASHNTPPCNARGGVSDAGRVPQRRTWFTYRMHVQALLTPMANSLLFAGTPLGIAAAMFVAQRLASGIGRVPAILCLRWLGVALLLLMAAAPCLWPVPVAILPIYLVRTACANGTSALGRSILMDFVPKVRYPRAGANPTGATAAIIQSGKHVCHIARS